LQFFGGKAFDLLDDEEFQLVGVLGAFRIEQSGPVLVGVAQVMVVSFGSHLNLHGLVVPDSH